MSRNTWRSTAKTRMLLHETVITPGIPVERTDRTRVHPQRMKKISKAIEVQNNQEAMEIGDTPVMGEIPAMTGRRIEGQGHHHPLPNVGVVMKQGT